MGIRKDFGSWAVILLMVTGGFVGFISFEPGLVDALNTHSPIVIIGNANFTTANGVTGGNGTASDPYIIEDWMINATAENGIFIMNTNVHFIIRNVEVYSTGSNIGIYFVNTSNSVVNDSVIRFSQYGIFMRLTTNSTVSNNTFEFNGYALYLDSYSINNSIYKNNFTSNSIAIYVNSYSDNNTIMNNELFNSYYWSITVDTSSNNQIISNSIINNASATGIYLYGNCINNTIDSNNISSVQNGIAIVSNSDKNNVFNNNVSNCVSDGIVIGSSHNNVSNNVAYDNGGAGLNLGGGFYNTIYNTIYNNDLYNNSDGIRLLSADHNNITENVVIRNELHGIYMSEAMFNNISVNNVSDNYDGIYLTSNSNKNDLTFNEVYNNSNDGIDIYVSNLNVINNNTVIHNRVFGIRLRSSQETNVTDNNVSDNDIGIYLRGSSNGLISGNDVYFNYEEGVKLGYSSNYVTIDKNTLVKNQNGISVDDSYGLEIRYNKVYSNYEIGIDLVDLYQSSLEYNDVYYNLLTGINLDDCGGIIIDNNNIFNNSESGLNILYGYSVHIWNNLIKWNDDGIYARFTSEIEFKNNEFIGNGLIIYESDLTEWRDVKLDTSNTVNGGPVYFWLDRFKGSVPLDAGQVYLINSAGVRIEHLKLDNSSVGITLAFSDNCIIANNTSSWNSFYGIQLYESKDNLIKDNSFSYNKAYGIYISSASDDNIVTSNVCNYNSGSGIVVHGSSDIKIKNNQVSYNKQYGINIDSPTENIDITGNICNFNVYSGISLRNTVDYNLIIRSNICDNNGNNGIFISEIESGSIENNYCRSNMISGIRLYHLSSSVISNNHLSSNNESGIFISQSSYNVINGSSLGYNQGSGMYLSNSNRNTILDNDIYYNEGSGIKIHLSEDNALYENTISNNHYGIHLDESDYNDIYHNSFISNEVQAVSDDYSMSNWNFAYPTGGNYWDDLSANDNFRGVDQSDPGRDGICDYEYNIGNVTDLYPLMKPLGQKPVPPEDLKAEVGYNYVKITWAIPDDNADFPVIEYIVKKSVYSYDIEIKYDKGSGTVYYNDTDVVPGKTIYYTITAINIVGESLPSETINATPGSVPPPPKDLKAYDEGNNISLNWKTPLNNGGFPIQNYRIYKGIVPGAEVFIKELDVVYTYFDENVVTGVTYYYRITAINERGEGPLSNEANATIYSVPQAPINLTGKGGDKYVYLTWEPPHNTGGYPILKYYVYRNTTTGEFEPIAKLEAYQLWYNDTNVDFDITYYYKVRAMNQIDKGTFTEAIGITPEKAKIKAGNELPRAFISVEVTEGPPPLTVNFTGSGRDNDGIIMSYSWDFDDGTTSTSQSPDHTFEAPGVYYVKLYVFDNEGGSSMAMVTITVTREFTEDPEQVEKISDEDKRSAWPVIALGLAALVVVAIILLLFVFPIFVRKPPPEEESRSTPQVREVTVYRIVKVRKQSDIEKNNNEQETREELEEEETILIDDDNESSAVQSEEDNFP